MHRLGRLKRLYADFEQSWRERSRSPRLYPKRIGVLILIELLQDADLLIPIIEAALRDDRFEVRVLMTDWHDFVAPQIPERLARLGVEPVRLLRRTLQTPIAPRLQGWDALLTASESTAPPHRFSHALTRRARQTGLATLTLQHGLENVGLNYRADGEFDFASETILTWCDPNQLPPWVAPSVRQRCRGVGRPLQPVQQGALPVENSKGRDIVAVFENLHWSRYNDSFRATFVTDLRATAARLPSVLFLAKPHPAGQWLSGVAPASPPNLVICDPTGPWRGIAAVDVIGQARAVITTPSTVALDAACLKRPVAIAGYDLDLEMYQPLPVLRNQADWRDFVVGAIADGPGAEITAFRERQIVAGDGIAAILEEVELAVGRLSSPQR